MQSESLTMIYLDDSFSYTQIGYIKEISFVA